MKKIGNSTYELDKTVFIAGGYSLVGRKEASGPFGKYFSESLDDDTLGEKTFEKSERIMHEMTIKKLMNQCGVLDKDIDLILSGDLLNQLATSNYSARNFNIPFLGLYSACSSFTEALIVGSSFIESGGMNKIISVAGSHFSSAERQYRNPLEFGNQRQTYSQWTVTGMGASLLSSKGDKSLPKIKKMTIGKVIDYGVSDIANMGAAMAPAAMNTLVEFFKDTKTLPRDYDLIATGDLGKLGSDILKDLMREEGYLLEQNYTDCGHMIYSSMQNSFQGGSGAGASAVVFNSYIYKKLLSGEFKKVLLLATGALMSVTTNQQGDTIPAISHLVMFEGGEKNE